MLPGATYEGHSLLPALKGMQQRRQVERMVFVADCGMLNAWNLQAMDALSSGYVVDARLRSLPTGLQDKVLDTETYAPLEGSANRRVAKWDHKSRRPIIAWRPERDQT